MQETITNQVIKQGAAIQLNKDTNNCTVLALAATTGVSYDEAYNIAKNIWLRKSKKGVRTNTLNSYFTNDLYAKKIDTKKVYHIKHSNKDVVCKMTVGTFAKEYPKGNYYVLVSGHALAINDGKILDHANLIPKSKRIIKHAWKIK
jgi:hypothetical protein